MFWVDTCNKEESRILSLMLCGVCQHEANSLKKKYKVFGQHTPFPCGYHTGTKSLVCGNQKWFDGNVCEPSKYIVAVTNENKNNWFMGISSCEITMSVYEVRG